MSKLSDVLAALKSNSAIEVVSVRRITTLPEGFTSWADTADIFVAPRRPIGQVVTLQLLLESLVPNVRPTMMDKFHAGGSSLALGKLYFDEMIGTVRVQTEIVLSDVELHSQNGFVNGAFTSDKTRNVERRTWVRLFPSIRLAQQATTGEGLYHLDNQELQRL